jgi:hypothetical protein
MTGFSTALRRLWLGMTGRRNRSKDWPEVIYHDPAAERPQDLDNPYLDPKVQSRMADVIASNAGKKT